MSLDSYTQRSKDMESLLDRAKKISDRSEDLQLLITELEDFVEGQKFTSYVWPMNNLEVRWIIIFILMKLTYFLFSSWKNVFAFFILAKTLLSSTFFKGTFTIMEVYVCIFFCIDPCYACYGHTKATSFKKFSNFDFPLRGHAKSMSLRKSPFFDPPSPHLYHFDSMLYQNISTHHYCFTLCGQNK